MFCNDYYIIRYRGNEVYRGTKEECLKNIEKFPEGIILHIVYGA